MATAAAFLDIGICFIWGGIVMSLIPPTKLWFNPTYHPGDRVCRTNFKMTATPIIFSFGIELLD